MDVNISPEVQKEVSTFLMKVVSPAADLAEIFSDKLRFWRWRNLHKIISKAEGYIAASGQETQRIPLKVLLPILEKASLEEEDDDLADRWSALIANTSVDPSGPKLGFASILSEIDGQEARILSGMSVGLTAHEVFKLNSFASDPSAPRWSHPDLAFVEKLGIASSDDLRQPGRFVLSIHEDSVVNTNELSLESYDDSVRLAHLEKLGLLRLFSSTAQDSADYMKRVYLLIAEITPFGFEFVRCCEAPEEQE